MDILTLFTIAGVVIFIGFIGEWIFQKTNIPDVIWLMILGIFVGHFFDFAKTESFTSMAPIFTTFALLFILFEGAINIDIKKLAKGVVGGSSLSFMTFSLSLVIVSLVMLIFGWGIWEGLLLGAIVGGSSSAVIIPIVKKLSIKPHTSLILTFESAITDVLCIVGALTIINIIMLQAFDVGFVIKSILYSFIIAIVVGIIIGLLWVKVQKWMNNFTKSYMTTIAVLLLLYGFVEFLGSNGAIACLSFGIIVGNSKKIFSFLDKGSDYAMTPSEKFFYSEISFFVKTFFFVYLGLLMNLTNIKLILVGLLLTILLFMVRPIAVAVGNRRYGLKDKDKTFVEILIPKGLAAAVLAQLPAQYGVPYGEQFSTIVLSVIMFSILLSTIGVFFTEKGKFPGLWTIFKGIIIKKEASK